MTRSMKLCGHDIGIEHPFFLIAGPDTLESQELAIEVAGHIAPLAKKHNLLYIFKGSYDKANRSPHKSYRGPGLQGGMKIMEAVRKQIGVPVLTDVHEDTPLKEVADGVDVIQTPAFLGAQPNFMLCERGFSFGYNNLVADMRGLAVMRAFAPVVFDGTHTVQLPGGMGN